MKKIILGLALALTSTAFASNQCEEIAKSTAIHLSTVETDYYRVDSVSCSLAQNKWAQICDISGHVGTEDVKNSGVEVKFVVLVSPNCEELYGIRVVTE